MRCRLILWFAIQFLFFEVRGQAPAWQWEAKMGSFYSDIGTSVATDKDGNVYTTGRYEGTADFDPGPGVYNLFAAGFGSIQNVFISKLDASGNFVWAKSIGDADHSEIAYGIAIDSSGNIYIAGDFGDTTDFNPDTSSAFTMVPSGGDVFILKLDSAGNFIWARKLGGNNNDDAKSIAVDQFGNVYTVGIFRDTADFDPDSSSVFTMVGGLAPNVFISKLDSSGNFIWAKQFNSNTGIEINSVTVDENENVYTTGWSNDTVDFDPGAGVYIHNPGPGTGSYTFISKLDSNGNYVWAKTIGDTTTNRSYDITTDNSGDVYVTGAFSGSVDFDPDQGVAPLVADGPLIDIFILRLNSSGEYVWAKRMGGPTEDYGASISVDQGGNVICSGAFTSAADFDPDSTATFIISNPSNYYSDIFVAGLDNSGNFLWAKSAAGNLLEWVNGMSLDQTGNIFITGAFTSQQLMFDSAALINTATGAHDILVAKLDNSLINNLSDHQNSSFIIFPDPAEDYFRIISNTKIEMVNVFNSIGQVLLSSCPLSGATELKFNVPELQTGIYFVQLQTSNGTSVKKLIKQ